MTCPAGDRDLLEQARGFSMLRPCARLDQPQMPAAAGQQRSAIKTSTSPRAIESRAGTSIRELKRAAARRAVVQRRIHAARIVRMPAGGARRRSRPALRVQPQRYGMARHLRAARRLRALAPPSTGLRACFRWPRSRAMLNFRCCDTPRAAAAAFPRATFGLFRRRKNRHHRRERQRQVEPAMALVRGELAAGRRHLRDAGNLRNRARLAGAGRDRPARHRVRAGRRRAAARDRARHRSRRGARTPARSSASCTPRTRPPVATTRAAARAASCMASASRPKTKRARCARSPAAGACASTWRRR